MATGHTFDTGPPARPAPTGPATTPATVPFPDPAAEPPAGPLTGFTVGVTAEDSTAILSEAEQQIRLVHAALA